jgi:hypothetical protein
VILEKGIIPPNALFEKVNPAIDVDFYKTKVPPTDFTENLLNLRRRRSLSTVFRGQGKACAEFLSIPLASGARTLMSFSTMLFITCTSVVWLVTTARP